MAITHNQALQNSIVTFSGGSLDTSSVTLTAPIFGGLSGSQNISFGGTPSVFTINRVAAGTPTYSGALSGAMGLTVTGTNAQYLTGANTYTGMTTISGGATLGVNSLNKIGTPLASSALGAPTTLANGIIYFGANGGTLLYNGPGETSDRPFMLMGIGSNGIIENDSAGTLTLNGSTTLATGNANLALQGTGTGGNYAGPVNLAGYVIKAGTGTWTLSGNNSPVNGTQLNAGTLIIGSTGALGSYPLIFGGGTAVAGVDLAGTPLTGGITLAGAGTFGVSSFNVTENGATTNSGGNRTLANNSSGLLTLANVYLSEMTTTGRILTIGGTGNVTIGGAIANANTIGVGAAGGIAFAGSGTYNVNGVNTYTGLTTVSSGAVTINGTMGATNIALSGGALTLSNPGALSQSVLTITGGTFNQTVPNAISGSAGLTVNGATVVLNMANNYTGATNVSAGTLQVQGSGVLPGASPIGLGATGILQIRDDGAGSGGTIDHSTNNITLSAAGSTTTIDVANNGSSTGNTVAFGGLYNGTPGNNLTSTINFTGANPTARSP